MHEVEELFEGASCKTVVWVSLEVINGLADYQSTEKHRGFFLKKLRHCAESGFKNYIRDDNMVRPEWGGVFRVGHRNSLFRLIGFLEDDANFIGLDTFLKCGQKLSSSQRARIDVVAEVKRTKNYRKKRHGNYPRLAEDT